MPPKKDAKKTSQARKKPDTTLSSKENASSRTQGVLEHKLPIEVLQIILSVFNTAFPMSTDHANLIKTIQSVKGHLYNRDFAAAFSEQSSLDAYAVRWSAARALGYAEILLQPQLRSLLTGRKDANIHASADRFATSSAVKPSVMDADAPQASSLSVNSDKAICIGGGAGAEVVALATVARAFQSSVSILAVDSANWSNPTARLRAALSTAPVLSAYASEATTARPENQALLETIDGLNINFLQQDVLEWQLDAMRESIWNAKLCTIMFTLNELFSTSLPKTTTFLLNLTQVMPTDSHLLVVDSPGSYSEIELSKRSAAEKGEHRPAQATKKYPMKWLLDHTLLDVANIDSEPVWKKVESEDSLWFRIDRKNRERLKYPVELENMRYQMHIYRRLAARQESQGNVKVPLQ